MTGEPTPLLRPVLNRMGVLLVLLSTYGGLARAQDPADDRAQVLYDNGVALYDEGRYEDAVSAWTTAYALSHRPLLLYNMANAEERLGLYLDAIDHLDHYRAYATAEERDPLDRRIKSLERRMDERAALGVTAAPTWPPPVPFSSDPPSSALSITAAPPAPAPAPAAVVAAEVPAPLVRPARSTGRPAAVALLSIGAVGLGAGSTFGGLALAARSDARSKCADGGKITWCPSRAEASISADRTFSILADSSFVVGIASAIGGTIAVTRRRPASVTLQVSPAFPLGDVDAIRLAGVF